MNGANSEFLPDDEDGQPRLGSSGDPIVQGEFLSDDEFLHGSVMEGYDPNEIRLYGPDRVEGYGVEEPVIWLGQMGAAGVGRKLGESMLAPVLERFAKSEAQKRLAPMAAMAIGGMTGSSLVNAAANPVRESFGDRPVSFLENLPGAAIDTATIGGVKKALPDEVLRGTSDAIANRLEKGAATRTARLLTPGESAKNFIGNIFDTEMTPYFQSEFEKASKVALDDGLLKGLHGGSTENIAKRIGDKVKEYGPMIEASVERADAAMGGQGFAINSGDIREASGIDKYIASLEADPKAAAEAEKAYENTIAGLLGSRNEIGLRDGGSLSAERLLEYKRSVANVTDFDTADPFGRVKNEIRRLVNIGLDKNIEKKLASVSPQLAFDFEKANAKTSAYLTIAPEAAKLAAIGKKDSWGRTIGKTFSNPGTIGTTGALMAAGLAKGAAFGPMAGAAALIAGAEGSLPAQVAKIKAEQSMANWAREYGPNMIRGAIDLPLAAGVRHYAQDAQAQEPQAEEPLAGPSKPLPVLFPTEVRADGAVPSVVDPFANGLSRQTDMFDSNALNRFVQATANRPTGVIAQGLAQKYEEAVRAEDKFKQQRIVADMAKLFPDVFEPGMGVDDRLFHPDDQAEYMDMLKGAHKSGKISSIFMGKQMQSFADKNDSRVLPIDEEIAKLAPQGTNIPPQNGEPRQYPY